MTRTYLCYAFGQDGEWEALCRDLDIAVQGGSFEQVDGYLRRLLLGFGVVRIGRGEQAGEECTE